MNGRERPCENSTTNTAILPLGYAFRQEYVLAPISGESFSAGLCRAKTTEVCAVVVSLPSGLLLLRSGLPPSLLAVAPTSCPPRAACMSCAALPKASCNPLIFLELKKKLMAKKKRRTAL